MINPLYYITNIVFAAVLLIVYLHDSTFEDKSNSRSRSYGRLLKCVIFFCIQDAAWGFFGSVPLYNGIPFFISSTVFHLSTVTTAAFWMIYVINYAEHKPKHMKLWKSLLALVCFLQLSLLVVNLFVPIVFRISPGGEYVTYDYRPYCFINQYAIFMMIALISIYAYIKNSGKDSSYSAIFIFVLAPVVCGIFQYCFPEAPFYSIGYFIGSMIIHVYVTLDDREQLLIQNASTDELTGLWNRKSYEEEIMNLRDSEIPESFVFISMDVNELKSTNDNLGHNAGDELIIAAADCMKRCFGGYGRVYRTGGDEFCAMIYCSSDTLEEIKTDFENSQLDWKGSFDVNLSISAGFVKKSEDQNLPLDEMILRADRRMYSSKNDFYNSKGIDRWGQQEAYKALCGSYTKILKADLTEDNYLIIKMPGEEKNEEMGFRPKLFDWIKEFAVSGHVHEGDLEIFLRKTHPDFVRNFFLEGYPVFYVHYRRLIGGEFKKAMMEMVPAPEFTPEHQIVFLFVKNVN
ncbi:MAG: GGDEF domain-containing protein [Clostridia bacterium]|nr:GGDEF domain-containing protein [Clostridia bacterium]